MNHSQWKTVSATQTCGKSTSLLDKRKAKLKGHFEKRDYEPEINSILNRRIFFSNIIYK
jgi:hypothetical protein